MQITKNSAVSIDYVLKGAGDQIEVTIATAEAYGESDPRPVQTVQRGVFPEGSEIKVGARFHGAGSDGNPVAVTVTAIEGDNILIDGNRALAGQTLHFAVEIVDVRAAADDESKHGYIHGSGCSHQEYTQAGSLLCCG